MTPWQSGVPAAATPAAAHAISPTGLSLDGSSPSMTWRPDEFTLNQGYQEYRDELRSLIFHTAQSHGASGSVAPPRDPDLIALLAEEQRRETATILAAGAGSRVKYLANYVDQVAPWLDMFDSDRAFGTQITSLARTSPALLYSVLALSARQTERKAGGRAHSFDSLELYQEAIRLLAPLLEARDVQVIPICTLLCCLEMMSASAQDWRKHLEGCAALFSTFGVHGFSGGLLQAVFWCYARMDVCGALISDGTESTLLPLRNGSPLIQRLGLPSPNARALFRASPHPDMHANYAVYLCACACELLAQRTRFLELGERNGCAGPGFEDRWLALWDELQAWLADRPRTSSPPRSSRPAPFPRSSTPAAPPPPRRPGTGSVASPLWHAKRVCGISWTNPHHGCLNNAIQPLWVAGRLLTHKSEHQVLVRLIWNIEALTGWGTCWRIADLEEVWGYRVKRSGF
ncbi:unnamed protein product [Parascedosporium putredinis]|uniref:Uncharacterized protein n=1 Tax=Parascedosporium putredinis TaxID=1442378 RepID=A0A9P1H423_9PEZI|nr:unnamed protein product [Parascedosporium putredinis]CAI7996317.1 unnamed protein product [Parascedosporium putredinis]